MSPGVHALTPPGDRRGGVAWLRVSSSSSSTSASAASASAEGVGGGERQALLLFQIQRNLSLLHPAEVTNLLPAEVTNLTYWRPFHNGSESSLSTSGGVGSGVAVGGAVLGTGVGTGLGVGLGVDLGAGVSVGGGAGVGAAGGGGDDGYFSGPTDATPPPPWMPAVGVVLAGIILSAILGNALVVTAVASFRRLRSVTNYFVVSLAVADILVAVLVMPYSLLYEVSGTWRFGWVFCYFWISCDVTCCTASILHLCVISLDRYLAITSPLTYKLRMSRRRAVLAICCVWACSAGISFVPIYLGWFADTSQMALYAADATTCGLIVNKTYAVISASLSFYIPLSVMLVVYSRIYRIASRQAKEIERLERSVLHLPAAGELYSAGGGGGATAGTGARGGTGAGTGTGARDGNKKVRLKRTSRKVNKDFKALKTLGTLMGVFCVSWLPFFLMYVILPFCTSCDVPEQVVSAITWLGYVNSSINPAIYAYLNRDFRAAFKKLLCCSGERRWPVVYRRKWTATGGGGGGGCGGGGGGGGGSIGGDGQEFIGHDGMDPGGGGSSGGQNNVSYGVPLTDM